MDGLLHIRIAGRSYAVSALALIMAVIGFGYLGEVLLQGGLGDGPRGISGFGAIGLMECWAAGGVGAQAVFERGEWWRLISHIFLHGSVLHLLMNGWALYQLGRVTELIYGGIGLIIVFLVSGVAGGLVSCAWHAFRGDPSIAVGASGAICGLLGILLAHMRSRTDIVAQHLGRSLGTWAIIILVFGIIVPRVDNAAHIGGFVAGYLLARVLRTGHFLHMLRGWARWRGPVIAMVLAAVTAVALAIAASGARERYRDLAAAISLHDRIVTAIRVLDGVGGGTTLNDALRAVRAVSAGPRFRDLQAQTIDLLESEKVTRRPTQIMLAATSKQLRAAADDLAPDFMAHFGRP